MREEHKVIMRIAEIAEAIGWQAGVGGMDTAGAIVSYLANHPEQIDALLIEGVFATEHELYEYPEQGCLTWVGMNGKIVTPKECRRSRLIKRMEKGAQQ